MNATNHSFSLEECLEHLKHYLPSQAPLKDFIHHNTLHAFQEDDFHIALEKAATIFGYKVYLELKEYRVLFAKGAISESALEKALAEHIESDSRSFYRTMLLNGPEDVQPDKRIGQVRHNWKSLYKVDMDSRVHPQLFRLISSYIDQGVAVWHFPSSDEGFLASVRKLEQFALDGLFRSKRVKQLLQNEKTELKDLLTVLLGKEQLFENYLFDQQFAHPGWSGMVSVLEDAPNALLHKKPISLHDLIFIECLFEIDVLDDVFGKGWEPIGAYTHTDPLPLFSPVRKEVGMALLKIWQDAYEWSYYDQVLNTLEAASKYPVKEEGHDFQALFCMDDRECSIRRHLELIDSKCQTFGTPGHFNLEFFFQPEGGQFVTKVCPVPTNPQVLIKEVENKLKKRKDLHFSERNHGLFGGVVITTLAGWLAPFKLALNIVKPSISPLTSSPSKHMDPKSKLIIENQNGALENGLQVGFTIDQMTDRLEGLLRSIGLTSQFSPLIYMIGHGSTSVNNTHYAGYDCGACSGRPGSVNARVIAWIGNHPPVRKLLKERGIEIPYTTHFVGALHDTSRDEIHFFDTDQLNESAKTAHEKNEAVFKLALSRNAKERSRRFMSINTRNEEGQVHERVKLRTVSLFEPRPELNHATNALAVVGRRQFTEHAFLDRRAFMNSYDYRIDPEGRFLETILNAVAPVAGGINLEYYFSRVDNQQLGAGTKLPHNVVGLIGVANGIDGDLRTGLPYQMIEVHDPMRLLVIVEHKPDVVLQTIQRNQGTYNWFHEEWVHLVVWDPEAHQFYRFRKGVMEAYEPLPTGVEDHSDLKPIIESSWENINPFIIKK